MAKLAVIGSGITRFAQRLNAAAFGLTASTVIQPKSYGKLASLTVGKQQLIAFGSTSVKAGGGEGEPIFIDLRDASDAKVEGQVRLAYYDANGRQLDVILDERTERLRSDANDRNKARLLPEWARACPEDLELRVEFYPDSASAVTILPTATTFGFLIPITKAFL